MKSIPLSQSIRGQIAESVRQKWIENNPEPDLETAADVLGKYVWRKAYGKYEKAFAAVPDAFLRRTHKVYFQAQGEVTLVVLSYDVPTNNPSYHSTQVLHDFGSDEPRPLKKYRDVQAAHSGWLTEQGILMRETNELLNSVKTTKQLLELWPQVEPFLPPHVADPERGVKLPAIPISRLNERLGIKG